MKKTTNICLYILALLIVIGAAVAEPLPKYGGIVIRDKDTFTLFDKSPTLVNQVPDPAEPGSYVELRFKIENIGGGQGGSVTDVVFELVPTYPFSLTPGDTVFRKAGNLHMQQVGEEAFMAYYKLRVDKDAIEGNNPIKIRYTVDGGVSWTQKEFAVRVQTNDAVLAIDPVIIDPEQIQPGGTGIITLTLVNTADSLLRDVVVTLGILTNTATSTSITTRELPLTPLGSTNQKTVDVIGARGQHNLSFTLIADPDAASAVYKLPLIMTYSDGLGKNYSRTLYTSVIIGGEPDFAVTIDSTQIYTSGTSGSISIKFTNKGAADVKFVYATLLENDQFDIISVPEVYVGHVDSDDYETADFSIYAKSTRASSIQLPLRISYRDATNTESIKEVILSLPLYSSGEAQRYGLVKAQSPLGGIIFLVIILGIVWWFFKRKKNIDIFKVGFEKVKMFLRRFKKRK